MILTSKRLFLRHVQLEDSDAFFALDRDPDVMRYIGDGSVYTDPEVTKAALGRIIAARGQRPGLGLWACCRQADGSCLGRLSRCLLVLRSFLRGGLEPRGRAARRAVSAARPAPRAGSRRPAPFDRRALDLHHAHLGLGRPEREAHGSTHRATGVPGATRRQQQLSAAGARPPRRCRAPAGRGAGSRPSSAAASDIAQRVARPRQRRALPRTGRGGSPARRGDLGAHAAFAPLVLAAHAPARLAGPGLVPL